VRKKAAWTHDSILFHVAALLLLLIKSGAKSFVVQGKTGTGCAVEWVGGCYLLRWLSLLSPLFFCGSITRQQTHDDME